MDFITGAVFSGVLYDMLKHGVSVKAANLKTKFKGWIVGDGLAVELEKELAKLNLSDDMSELAITRKIENSNNLVSLLTEMKSSSKASVNQNHSGSGDNIAGNKVIHNK